MSNEVKKVIELTGKHGLHARPASAFVELSKKFSSDISIIGRGEEVDGKSIISILTLGLGEGSKITIKAVGDDAEKAISELTNLIKQGEAFN